MTATDRALDAFRALAPSRLTTQPLRTGVPLAPYTTFRIGGPADVLYDATSAEELANAVSLAREVRRVARRGM